MDNKIKRIIARHGGGIYEETAGQIIAEFTCTKRAAACCKELCRIGKKIKVVRAGSRVTATATKREG